MDETGEVRTVNTPSISTGISTLLMGNHFKTRRHTAALQLSSSHMALLNFRAPFSQVIKMFNLLRGNQVSVEGGRATGERCSSSKKNVTIYFIAIEAVCHQLSAWAYALSSPCTGGWECIASASGSCTTDKQEANGAPIRLLLPPSTCASTA